MSLPTPPADKQSPLAAASKPDDSQRGRLKACAALIVLIVLAFAKPLIALAQHAAHSQIHSHVLLIPFVSAYLFAIRRKTLPVDYRTSPGWAVGLAMLGTGALVLRWTIGALSGNDILSLTTFGFVCFVAAAAFAVLGRRWVAAAAFPIAFLIFMVPLPDLAVDRLEIASKLASAEVAAWFFEISGTSNLRDGTIFTLPTITIEVAQECSGIRSSLVLFITGLLAAELFLKSPARRLVLVLLVIPLGIIRNAFRILVIGMLCVHVGPHMIDSPLHHQGGPVFFVLSIVVLGGVLWLLRRGETRSRDVLPPPNGAAHAR